MPLLGAAIGAAAGALGGTRHRAPLSRR
ncbi:hypothetical protein [Streptomyces rubiginosohelvolus]